MTNQCTVTVSMPADVFQSIAGRSPILSKRRVTKHVSTLLSSNDFSAKPDHCGWIGDEFFSTQVVESVEPIDPQSILLNEDLVGVSVIPQCNVAV